MPYTIDDLIQFAKIGRFGNDQMNRIAFQAFLYLKKLQKENEELKKKVDEKDSEVKIFGITPNNIEY